MTAAFIGWLPALVLAAQAAQGTDNPLSRRISIPAPIQFDLDAGPYHRAQYTLELKPVIPLPPAGDLLIITRTILQLTDKPDAQAPTGSTFGLEDTLITVFASTREVLATHLDAGIGPAFQVPTATSTVLGTGRWSLGPSAAVQWSPPPFVFLLLVNQIWSVTGPPTRSPVSQLQLEYGLHYSFPGRWFLEAHNTVEADWEKAPGSRWSVPLGGGGGRSFDLGGTTLSAKVEAFDYVARQGSNAAAWQLQVEVSLLLPE